MKPGDFSPLCGRKERCHGALLPSSTSPVSKKGPSLPGRRGAAAPQAPLQPPSPAGLVASWVIHGSRSTRPTPAPPPLTQSSCRAAELFSTGSQRRTHKCPDLAKKETFLPAFGPKLQLKRGILLLRDTSVLSQACHNSPGEDKEAIINVLTKLLR